MDIPREGIVFVNKPHSTDAWIEQAFRQPIGLPDDMVPTVWKDLNRRNHRKGKMRGSRAGAGAGGAGASAADAAALEATTKKQTKPPTMTQDEEDDENSYQESLKRWNDVDTRREKLEELKEKSFVEASARADL